MTSNVINPFAPFHAEWYVYYDEESPIISHRDDIERMYTKLWQETCSTVGRDKNSLSIHDFAKFWTSKIIKH